MPEHKHANSPLELVDDTSWEAFRIAPGKIDPGIRLVASLIDARDAAQLYRRTGMRLLPDGTVENPSLPLFLEVEPRHRIRTLEALGGIRIERSRFAVSFPRAYLERDAAGERSSIIPARLAWSQATGAESAGGLWQRLRRWWRRERAEATAPISLREAIAELLKQDGVARLSLPNPLQPTLEDSLADMEMPKDRKFGGQELTGEGVVVGIIDDGCALAHPHFLNADAKTRLLFLWDQGNAAVPGEPYWRDPVTFKGRELTDERINHLLGLHTHDGRIREDDLYQALGHELDRSAHGTHVMDIAAGNGASLMGAAGVAAKADLIFVQLPRDTVQQGGALLEDSILQGVKYIFDRAGAKQAVVNISFGGYCGPHDGSSAFSRAVDEMLDAAQGRAVVVAAGNGFEADCHAQGVLPGAVDGATSRDLVWLLRPENSTSNQLEVWYEGDGQVEAMLKPPNRAWLPVAVGLGEEKVIVRTGDNAVMGWIRHEHHGAPGSKSNVIRINLGATQSGYEAVPKNAPGAQQQAIAAPPPRIAAAVPPGAWTLRLQLKGAGAATFHAWIERDENRLRRGRRAQQSRFQAPDVEPSSTVADLGTGRHVICVGAHNAVTGRMCRYSACGPTRDGRRKPELTAPAEETALGGGVLCASARSGRPGRMGGTSAAAPHVAGLVALLMQKHQGAPLTAAQMHARVAKGARDASGKPPPATRAALLFDNRQENDGSRQGIKRQSDVWAAVTGDGKANAAETMK